MHTFLFIQFYILASVEFVEKEINTMCWQTLRKMWMRYVRRECQDLYAKKKKGFEVGSGHRRYVRKVAQLVSSSLINK